MKETEITTHSSPLDAQVASALAPLDEEDIGSAELLIASSTGIKTLSGALQDHRCFTLESGQELHTGSLEGHTTWITEVALDDVDGAPPWLRALPLWMAAAKGCKRVIHTSAGTSLAGSGHRPHRLARISDHVNLSGSSPLTGLGISRLGPLFPDQTRVHDRELGALAHRAGADLGDSLFDAVAACTIGPALATPSEFRWYSAAGADIAVQGLATPLVASAHAGLSGVALCAITDHADEATDVATLVKRTAAAAPQLDALVLKLVSALPEDLSIDGSTQ